MSPDTSSPTLQTARRTPFGPGAHCPGCDYSLVGLSHPLCPECGREVGSAEAVAAAARVALRLRSGAIVRTAALLPAGVGVLLSVVVAFFPQGLEPAIVVLTLGSMLAMACVFLGLPVAALSRPWERGVVLLAWLRCSWWLLLPWLSLPLMAVLAVGVCFLQGVLSVAADPFLTILVVVAPPWITLCITGVLAWAGAWFEHEKLIVRRSSARAVAVFMSVAILLTLSAAAALVGAWMLASTMLIRWMLN